MAAATAITYTNIKKFNTMTDFIAPAAIDATNGALITFDKADQRILVMLENSSATTAYTFTVKKGNGIQGVKDLAVSVGTSSKKVVVLESGAFKNVEGTNIGKVHITGSHADQKVAAVVLP